MGWEGRLRPEMQLRLCNSGRYEHRQQAREGIVVVQRLVEVRSQGLKEAKMVGAATYISHILRIALWIGCKGQLVEWTKECRRLRRA